MEEWFTWNHFDCHRYQWNINPQLNFWLKTSVCLVCSSVMLTFTILMFSSADRSDHSNEWAVWCQGDAQLSQQLQSSKSFHICLVPERQQTRWDTNFCLWRLVFSWRCCFLCFGRTRGASLSSSVWVKPTTQTHFIFLQADDLKKKNSVRVGFNVNSC